MDVETKLKWHDVAKIKKLADTNNVEVSFLPHLIDRTISPPVIIGRKQLVILLEEVADEYEETKDQYPGCYAQALENAKSAREHLWPKSL